MLPQPSSQFSAGALRDALKRARARVSLLVFIRLMDPNFAIVKHVEYVANALQEQIEGWMREPNMLLRMPPRHSKTSLLTFAMAWHLGRFPKLDVLFASGRENNVGAVGQQIRDYLQSPQWPFEAGIRSDSKAKDDFQLEQGGRFRAVTVGGSCQGENYHLGVVDDPIPGSNFATKTLFEKQIDWFEADFFKRRQYGAHTVVSYFPWADGDLGSYILNHEDAEMRLSWRDLALRAYAREEDPMGREPGAILFPLQTLPDGRRAGFPKEFYEEVRRLNKWRWQAQYELDPLVRGDIILDVELLLEDGKPVPMPDKAQCVVAFIDTAMKTTDRHDSTAVLFVAFNKFSQHTMTILDWDVIQISSAAQASWMDSIVHTRGEELAKRCNAWAGYLGAMIEDKQTGTVLLDMERQRAYETRRRPRAFALDSRLTAIGKDNRALAAMRYLVEGRVRIAEPAFNKTKMHKGRTGNHLLMQLQNFRLDFDGGASSDDLTDTFSYAVLATCGRPTSNTGYL